MGHEDDRAFEVLQRLLEHLLGRDVEMVGGLVKQQQARVVEHQLRERDAALLSAAQRPNRLEGIIAMEEQPAEKGAQRLLGKSEGILQLTQHRLAGIEIGEVLVVVAHGDPRADLDASRQRPQLAE